jgi:cytochrome b561
VNGGARYTGLAISLHWLIALLIFAGWALGFYMHDLSLSPAKLRYYSWHKWMGVTTFILAFLRVGWLATHPAPRLPRVIPPWQTRTARTTHFVLYLLMFLIPLSGWLMSSAKGVPTVYFGVLPLPDLIGKDKALGDVLVQVHKWLAFGLAALVCLHIAAAIKHHFIDRDGLMGRMVPFLKPPRP